MYILGLSKVLKKGLFYLKIGANIRLCEKGGCIWDWFIKQKQV